MSWFGQRLHAAAGDRRGVAAIEFAVVAPLLLLIIAGMSDIGGLLFTRFGLEAAAAAAANDAIVRATSVNAAGGAALASDLARITANAQGASWASASVTVNNGPSAAQGPGGGSSGGTAAPADACYCPTGVTPAIAWGLAKTCGVSCPSGGFAGKFVVVTASRPYTPLFFRYGLIKDRTLTTSSVVQVQ